VNELENLGINLVVVSIGTPENGKKLMKHLSIPHFADFFYMDPKSVLYDSLNLNKGVVSTLFAPGTSFSFLRRFTQPDGMKELNEVLSKWNKGMQNKTSV
jgi:hypothetical protein